MWTQCTTAILYFKLGPVSRLARLTFTQTSSFEHRASKWIKGHSPFEIHSSTHTFIPSHFSVRLKQNKARKILTFNGFEALGIWYLINSSTRSESLLPVTSLWWRIKKTAVVLPTFAEIDMYMPRVYYLPGTVLSIWDTMVNKTKCPAPWSLDLHASYLY